ncbi:retinol-binding protein 3 [Clarias magur]|uniref:Retinol-binding protein 3 n=1 Tax=Clarias magur TaxID=1594786 RepID=A0A8J4TXR0_CLAMG|nr:retinol-binding protein 3 [Clarias magur]
MAQGLLLLATLLAFCNVALCNFSPTLITDLAKVLLENYCSPERLSGMEEVITIANSNTEILSIQDPSILASILTDGVMSTIGDPRVKVLYDPRYVPAAPPGIPDIPLEQLAAVVKSTVNVEVLENDIAYLKIQHIIGEEIAQKIGPLLLQHVWDKVLPTSAMILDLRYAVSGELSGIPYIVSYFTDADPLIHIDSVYDRPSNSTTELWSMPSLLGKRYGTSKPLIILTSKNTVGIAEDVAYCLKNLKRATIVGENTAGGSVKIEKLKLGNTDFYVSVPVAKSTNPITRKSWEVKGVAPDVEVNAEASFHTDVLENNIGYMRFDMFGDFPQDATFAQIIVEHVWNKVVDTDAMIIDLRNNVGGSTSPIAGLCSYFFDEDMQIVLDKLYDRSSGTTRVLATLQELTGRRYGSKKGLLILTSGVTAGAAEEFVYIMKKFGRAMIVGEPTYGSCQPPKTFQVSNSDAFLAIPVMHSDTTQGPAWEGAGIAPHVAVSASEALDVAKGILNKHLIGQK